VHSFSNSVKRNLSIIYREIGVQQKQWMHKWKVLKKVS